MPSIVDYRSFLPQPANCGINGLSPEVIPLRYDVEYFRPLKDCLHISSSFEVTIVQEQHEHLPSRGSSARLQTKSRVLCSISRRTESTFVPLTLHLSNCLFINYILWLQIMYVILLATEHCIEFL